MADARQPDEHRSNGQENGENGYSAYGSAYRENGYHSGAAAHPGATGMNTVCIPEWLGGLVCACVCMYMDGPQLLVKVICCVRRGYLIHPKGTLMGSAGLRFSGGLQTFQSRASEIQVLCKWESFLSSERP